MCYMSLKAQNYKKCYLYQKKCIFLKKSLLKMLFVSNNIVYLQCKTKEMIDKQIINH